MDDQSHEYLNQAKLYVGRVTAIDEAVNRCIEFNCPILGNDSLRAIPATNHTSEIKLGDDVLIIQPERRFSDTLFYLPIKLDTFVGIRNGGCEVDITNKSMMKINAPDALSINVGQETSTHKSTFLISDSGKFSMNGNLSVSGSLECDSYATGTIVDLSGKKYNFKKGLLVSIT